ncbi:hypothetical protein V6N13_101190 [Hibiscus sabdariffa]
MVDPDNDFHESVLMRSVGLKDESSRALALQKGQQTVAGTWGSRSLHWMAPTVKNREAVVGVLARNSHGLVIDSCPGHKQWRPVLSRKE